MRRVGIKDVARAAGVSVTTVSLVLNSAPGARIPVATQDRVRRVAQQVGYRPNTLAQNLRTQQTQTIGFVSDEIATTPYAVRMVAAAQAAARAHGFLLFLVTTDGDPAAERAAVETLLNHQVAGFVYAAMYHRVVDPPPLLPAATVFLDCRPASGSGPAVVPDDRAGAVTAVSALVDAGHRRIAYVDDEAGRLASVLRAEGYRAALDAAAVAPDPRLHVRTAVSAAGGALAAGALLELPRRLRPTALFCFNDRIAMGAYRAARLRGLRIPADLSIVGYDDQQLIAAELDPPLTTIALPHAAMGRWAVERLVSSLAAPATGEEPVTLMPCPLITRESVGPPPG